VTATDYIERHLKLHSEKEFNRRALLDIFGDNPYEITSYEDLDDDQKAELDAFNLSGMLTDALAEDQNVDYREVAFILGRLSALQKPELIPIVLGNLERLYPVADAVAVFFKDPKEKALQQRKLFGMSISSKRYAIYERHGEQITIINPKAHGLGYLYPPVNSPKGWDDDHEAPKWIYDLWLWIVQKVLGLKPVEPEWFNRPQMMRVCVSTENVLREQCHGWNGFRPFNFFMRPMISPLGVNVNPSEFALAAPMESDQTKWIGSRCTNICDPEDERKYKITTDPMESVLSPGIILVNDFRHRAHTYIQHPESKALAPDGSPCTGNTRGLLQRAHIIVDKVKRISKECDRRWEDGEDADAIEFEPPNYDNNERDFKDYVVPREKLIRKIKKLGIRRLIRRGCS
jgi:hypothetical protein